jgi:hypothetical protein
VTFISPWSLLWLAPIVGTIILLYLLKMRRQDIKIPAVFLWPSMTSDIRANAPFQKLRFSLLLLLQLIAAILIIAAFADPVHRIKGFGGAATVIVLDDSASMQATDVSPTRFQHCIERVHSLIDSLEPGDRMALILAGNETRIVFPLSSDKLQMQRSLQSITPSDAQSNMGDALRLAAALVTSAPSSKILVLSDGNFEKVSDFSPGRANLIYEPVGTTYKNAAITSFNSSLSDDGKLVCFAAIHNFDSLTMNVKMEFSIDGNLSDAREITIGPGQNNYQTFNAPPTGNQADLTISSPGDILAADNHATIFLKGAGTIRTLLVTDGDLFLENALSLDPSIKLEKASDVPDYELASSQGAGRYDLVIFDNLPPKPVKAPAIWSMGVPDKSFGVRETGIDLHPRVVDWQRQDSVMRFADLSSLSITKSHIVENIPGYGARVLVTGATGPMVVASQNHGKRSLYTSWSLLDSDFPLRVSFPIFVANSVSWLTSGGARASSEQGGLTEQAGNVFSVSTPDGTATLTDPSGNKTDLDASSGAATIRTANQVGIYHVDSSHLHTAIAVNILNESASDVRTQPEINLGISTISASKTSGFILSEIWRWIVGAVLLILCAEWWVFVRRS